MCTVTSLIACGAQLRVDELDSADVHAAICSRDPGASACFVATREGKWHADLYALARRALARAGVDAAAIHGGGRCTYSENGAFYSYRRGGAGRDARMATLIWLAPD